MPFKYSYSHTFLLEVDITEKMWLKRLKNTQIYIFRVVIYVHMICMYK